MNRQICRSPGLITALSLCAALCTCLSAGSAAAQNEFRQGCSRAFTEVWCKGFPSCRVSALREQSAKDLPNTSKSGYSECKEYAETLMKKGGSLAGKRASARMQAKLDELNAQLAKDSFHINVTADFKRLELEDLWYAEYKNRADLSSAVTSCPDEKCYQWTENHLKVLRDTLYSIAKDKLGREALESKVKEIRYGFFTNFTCDSTDSTDSTPAESCKPELKLVDKVLIVPGVYVRDQANYTSSLKSFLERQM